MTIAVQARDMTRREFNAALKRRGWRKTLVWIDVGFGRNIGMVMLKGRHGYKTNLRASLAHAIRETGGCNGDRDSS